MLEGVLPRGSGNQHFGPEGKSFSFETPHALGVQLSCHYGATDEKPCVAWLLELNYLMALSPDSLGMQACCDASSRSLSLSQGTVLLGLSSLAHYSENTSGMM